VGLDSLGARTSITLDGEADYCRQGAAEAGVLAVRGDGQNNRCHEIDGCTNPFADGSDTDARRNQPMPLANQNLNGPIEFGSGTIPPNEFFVHGQAPARPLGCNIHDTCYQTCVQGEAAKAAISPPVANVLLFARRGSWPSASPRCRFPSSRRGSPARSWVTVSGMILGGLAIADAPGRPV
jgi:hypothetical protein